MSGDLNPDLSNARTVLHQLSYQAKWELVIMQVDDKLARNIHINFNPYFQYMKSVYFIIIFYVNRLLVTKGLALILEPFLSL